MESVSIDGSIYLHVTQNDHPEKGKRDFKKNIKKEETNKKGLGEIMFMSESNPVHAILRTLLKLL